jgi:hypothetical protein
MEGRNRSVGEDWLVPGWKVVNHGDLSGVLLKIDRAKAHLDDFDRRAERVEAACRKAIIRDRDKQRSEYVFRFDRVPSIPVELNAIIGDAIHNLRASLDHLAWQLVLATGGTPSTGPDPTTFPIHEVPPSADRWGRTRPQINPGVPKKLRELLDEVQPYKRPKPAHHELAVLHRLDIIDKHRELLVTVLGLEGVGWWGEIEPTRFSDGPYHDGSEVCRFPYSSTNSENEVNLTISFAVRFDEPAAGPWSRTLGAADLVRRRPLRYIENEVLPGLQGFF